MTEQRNYTAFAGEKIIASGPLEKMLPQVKERFDQDQTTPLFLFEDESGKQVDFALRGTLSDVLASALRDRPRPGPGRPKLGVISREVSLLPRHWTWLEEQPNGASAAIRRLVDQAKKQDPDRQRARLAMDAAIRFMSSMAGNLPGYEEAGRALYAADRVQFERQIENWPDDIRLHVHRLARAAFLANGDAPSRATESTCRPPSDNTEEAPKGSAVPPG